MRIENITTAGLRALSTEELWSLRSRCINVHVQACGDGKGEGLEVIAGIEKARFMSAYAGVVYELQRRGLPPKTKTTLDDQIAVHLLRRAVWKIDMATLPEILVSPGHVAIGGAFVSDPKDAQDIEVFVKHPKPENRTALEITIERVIRAEVPDKATRFVYDPAGPPEGSVVPLYDLILQPRAEARVEKVEKQVEQPTGTRQTNAVRGDGEGEAGEESRLACKVFDFRSLDDGRRAYRCSFTGLEDPVEAEPTALEIPIGSLIEVKAAALGLDKAGRSTLAGISVVGIAAADRVPSDLAALAKAEAEDLKEGDSGAGILQLHLLGLSEEEAEAVRGAGDRLVVARLKTDRLEALLGELIKKPGAVQLDCQLAKGASGSQFEFFVGDTLSLEKLDSFLAGKRKLRAVWKAGGGAMDVGARGPVLFEPGITAMANPGWGAVLRLDAFDWTAYQAGPHVKKLHVSGSRMMDGNWTLEAKPAGAGRVWLGSRLTDDDHEKVEKRLSPVDQADLEREDEAIAENKKKPEASKPHQFKAADWTAGNGHPRCLTCGDEESTGKVCNMPDSWYAKHDWDDEAAWLEERKKLRAEGVIKAFHVEKPYPNEHACRLIDPGQVTVVGSGERDHEGKKYRVLYARRDGKTVVQAHRYPKDAWTADAARAHCKGYGGTFEPAAGETKADSRPEIKFKILKADRKRQFVGGIVYEPDVADSQGDWTSSPEIEDMKFRFMERYAIDPRRFKIMHDGRLRTYPVIESFQPEQDTKKGSDVIKAGAWWIGIKVTDDDVWKAIEDGTLTGFSFGGTARKG